MDFTNTEISKKCQLMREFGDRRKKLKDIKWIYNNKGDIRQSKEIKKAKKYIRKGEDFILFKRKNKIIDEINLPYDIYIVYGSVGKYKEKTYHHIYQHYIFYGTRLEMCFIMHFYNYYLRILNKHDLYSGYKILFKI